MSGVAIVRYLLENTAGVTAKVPADQITAGATPINTPLPAIAVTEISSTERLNVAMNPAGKYLVTERVQVTAQAKTYADQKTILGLVLAALTGQHGTINAFACDSVLPDAEGPDVVDFEAVIYEQSQDFIVKFSR